MGREAPCAIPPVAEHVVWPNYTAYARAAEIEGYIDLQLTIDTKGRPHSVRVTRSLEGSLDQNAVQALKHWRFKPAMFEGHVVAVSATVQLLFYLCQRQREVKARMIEGSVAMLDGKHFSVSRNGMAAPLLVSALLPAYPDEMPAPKPEGSVLFSLQVNEVGSVTDVQIVRGLQPELAQPVLEAIKRWRFRPALYKNQPIPFKARAELQFQRCADPRVTLSFLQ